jgi:AmmeMemoRadiSam system protein B
MADTLPRLRMDLDIMPSPVEDRPGLLIRDPFHYSDAALIVPPVLVECLRFFDGRSAEIDLRAALVQLTGDLRVGEVVAAFRKALSEAGFLEDEVHGGMKARRQQMFASAECRIAALAGSGYPDDEARVRELLGGCLNGLAAPRRGLLGIAAPHVSLDGGSSSYGAAYGAIAPELHDRTFVILGTSHYGEPERFGLTRKPFVTPLGMALTDTALVDELERKGGPAVRMEDYCHAVEHSVEFQVLFLQRLFGPGVRILPILCGPFAHSVYEGGAPESDEGVHRFLEALGEIAAREAGRLFWVLGVDMAHIGRRYGDPHGVKANQGRMVEVEATDRRRIELLNAGDAAGFWAAVQERQDDLKWCGSSPFYTFLKAVPSARGDLLRYEQWNIDEQSVVSFAAIAFR